MRTKKDYIYKAKVVSVYDGDTITIDIDLGFSNFMKKQTIRLYGVNTPELRGAEKEEGKKVRDYVRDRILGKNIIIKSYKDKKGKYGRWLGEIFIDGVNLNEELLQKGFAKEFMKK